MKGSTKYFPEANKDYYYSKIIFFIILIFLSLFLYRYLSTKYDAEKRWRSAAMRISPALSAKMKKGKKKHTANGHIRNNDDNYPMGKIIY